MKLYENITGNQFIIKHNADESWLDRSRQEM